MDNLIATLMLAILGGFALAGLLILGVMGVVSFFRAWQRGEPEFSSSMPPQAPDRSPLHSLEARQVRGEPDDAEVQEMKEQVAELIRLQEAERQRIDRSEL